ncbi:MAG: hypothetical protein R8G60_13845 [Roseovarius pacificus]|nr:hypothetical protein [Roseovarius pacificus]
MNAAKRPARVLLGATCYTDAEGTMQIAVLAAREIGAELHGLLVVDESILAAASAPRARSVGFSGARIAQITAEQMQAAFRADARRFREQLLRAARGASLGAGFRQERGRLAAVLEQGAGAGDLIVYGFRRAPRDSDCVILIASATDSAPRLTALAAHLSEGLGKPLIVLVPAQTAEARPAPWPGLRGWMSSRSIRPRRFWPGSSVAALRLWSRPGRMRPCHPSRACLTQRAVRSFWNRTQHPRFEACHGPDGATGAEQWPGGGGCRRRFSELRT